MVWHRSMMREKMQVRVLPPQFSNYTPVAQSEEAASLNLVRCGFESRQEYLGGVALRGSAVLAHSDFCERRSTHLISFLNPHNPA